ncbi:HTH domain-containing protein [Salinigranum halophilum]|uniref:HTH domain-containing protein n=1 Tax=Salinigranum halophilum TaxID=2565931 RepID=UPI0010A7D89C
MRLITTTNKMVSESNILQVFESSSHPVLTATEISQELSVSRRTVLRRLHELEANGLVHSKEVGGRAIVWWKSD